MVHRSLAPLTFLVLMLGFVESVLAGPATMQIPDDVAVVRRIPPHVPTARGALHYWHASVTTGIPFWGVTGGADDEILFSETGWPGANGARLAVIRADPNGGWVWIRSRNGTGWYKLFGSVGDIPIMGDWDPSTPGDEIGVVRRNVAGGYLQWILEDNTPGVGFSVTTFGADTDTPVPGNWDGDASNGDEFGVVRPDGPSLLWITQGSGGLDYHLFGEAGDTPAPGDYDGDGRLDFAVKRQGTNVFIIETSPLSYIHLGLPTDEVVHFPR